MEVGLSLIVADSTPYTAKILQDLGDFPWITRVPETIGESLFLRKLLWASLPNKRQKLCDR
ncbi:hypothetical protein B0F87_102430 [Methylobacter tundripaludum]|uniref:Uncharacterized protein n=1 Tax=Methylobacter tundripaludum TaxID=173365 RepID=A0A2S6HIL2_9GAMM|nr:hypothetical protein B0F87_102430 [Methylobacter tundripaludum]